MEQRDTWCSERIKGGGPEDHVSEGLTPSERNQVSLCVLNYLSIDGCSSRKAFFVVEYTEIKINICRTIKH